MHRGGRGGRRKAREGGWVEKRTGEGKQRNFTKLLPMGFDMIRRSGY